MNRRRLFLVYAVAACCVSLLSCSLFGWRYFWTLPLGLVGAVVGVCVLGWLIRAVESGFDAVVDWVNEGLSR